MFRFLGFNFTVEMLFSLILIGLLGSASNLTPVSGKECTNTPTKLSPHFPHNLLLSFKGGNRHTTNNGHLHLNHAQSKTWMDLLPPQHTSISPEEKENRELNWAMLYRKINKAGNSDGIESRFLKEFSLHDVHLDPNKSAQGRAQQTNLEYLLLLNVDSLVWSFRKQAGLDTPGVPYGGWEGPEIEIRGHFVG